MNWLCQSLDAAARSSADYLAIMAYQRQMARELKLDPEEVLQLWLNLPA